MKLYAFSDFHLSGDPPTKPMDMFGENWKGHREKIIRSWLDMITDEDTVIMAGDLSWAMKMDDALSDLRMLGTLPGRKIIVRGNHDYWWDTVTKMKRMTENAFEFIHNSALSAGQIALAGTRGWIAETSHKVKEEDIPIIRREEGRLERSLLEAEKLPHKQIMAVLHYPPFDELRRPTRMLSIMKEHAVTDCIYGHIHGKNNFQELPNELEGIRLHLTSSDYLDFKPLFLCDLEDYHGETNS
ncbi:MAG: metallophosphoesterase [Dialister sp.]|nr:metallophosphoesterase [Dialister sp.]